MKIVLANPRGFCAGVVRAINIVKNALKIYGAPIYVRHEIVHNRYVVEDLRDQGVFFIKNLCEVPDGAVLIFSAHGTSQAVRREAQCRNLIIFDAICPLVMKVHMKVIRASRKGEEAILIGHSGHPEVEGTLGQYENPDGGIYLVESPKDVLKLNIKNETKISFMTQTTLSVFDTLDIIRTIINRFPRIIRPLKNDICYATANRQEAVCALAKETDVILVVGSKNSSNSNRLAELPRRMGKIAHLIDDANDIKKEWVKNTSCIGITAGASAPDFLVRNVIRYLRELGGNEPISMNGNKENTIFKVPKELHTHVHVKCSDTK